MTIDELIAKLEAATEGSRELDCDIFVATAREAYALGRAAVREPTEAQVRAVALASCRDTDTMDCTCYVYNTTVPECAESARRAIAAMEASRE